MTSPSPEQQGDQPGEQQGPQTRAQKAMKQTSRTQAEIDAEQQDGLGAQSSGGKAPPAPVRRTPGDTPLDQGGNHGSSPYQEPNDGRHEGRER